MTRTSATSFFWKQWTHLTHSLRHVLHSQQHEQQTGDGYGSRGEAGGSQEEKDVGSNIASQQGEMRAGQHQARHSGLREDQHSLRGSTLRGIDIDHVIQDPDAVVVLPQKLREMLDALLQSWAEQGQTFDDSHSISCTEDAEGYTVVDDLGARHLNVGNNDRRSSRSKSWPVISNPLRRRASFTHLGDSFRQQRQPQAENLMLTGAEMATFLGLITRLDDRRRTMHAAPVNLDLTDTSQPRPTRADAPPSPVDLAELDYDEDLIALYDGMTNEEKYYKKCGDQRVLEDRMIDYEFDYRDILSHRLLMKDQDRQLDISDEQFEAEIARQRHAFEVSREILEREVAELWQKVQEEESKYTLESQHPSQSPESSDSVAQRQQFQPAFEHSYQASDEGQPPQFDIAEQPLQIDFEALLAGLDVKPQERELQPVMRLQELEGLTTDDLLSADVETEDISQDRKMNASPPPGNLESMDDFLDTWLNMPIITPQASHDDPQSTVQSRGSSPITSDDRGNHDDTTSAAGSQRTILTSTVSNLGPKTARIESTRPEARPRSSE